MATKYGTSGFKFALGGDEMSGIYHEVVNAKELAVNGDVIGSLDRIAAILDDIDDIRKQILIEAERKAIADIVKELKGFYSSILDIVKGHTKNANKSFKEAGVRISSVLVPLGKIFSGDYEAKWGSIQGYMKQMAKVSKDDWELLNCLDNFKAMQACVKENDSQYKALLKKLYLAAEKKAVGPLLKAIVDETRYLGTLITYWQGKDKTAEQNEEKLTVALNSIWKKARQNQDRIKAANQAAAEKKKKEEEEKKNK